MWGQKLTYTYDKTCNRRYQFLVKIQVFFYHKLKIIWFFWSGLCQHKEKVLYSGKATFHVSGSI